MSEINEKKRQTDSPKQKENTVENDTLNTLTRDDYSVIEDIRDSAIDEGISVLLNNLREELQLILKKINWLDDERNTNFLKLSLLSEMSLQETLFQSGELPEKQFDLNFTIDSVLSKYVASTDCKVSEIYAEIGNMNSFES